MKEIGDIRFECVRKSKEDASVVMDWGNDPETRKMSYHIAPKVWESFYKEFQDEYFNCPELPPLFATFNGERVAFLRFQPSIHPEIKSSNCCTISINVAPKFRSHGLGKAILKEVCSWLVQQGIDAVLAEVKKENAISKKAFLSAGFRQISDSVKTLIDTNEEIPIFRFLFSSARETNQLRNESVDHVFVIAEAGSNWKVGSYEEDLAMSRQLILGAKEAGADAIKFQVFRPETTYVKNAGQSSYLKGAGIKDEISHIFSNLSMPYEMIPKLAKICKEIDIQFMATPFSLDDFSAIDPYVKIHKIASYEINHIHLLEAAANSGKPVILSTGASTEDEIAWSLDYLKSKKSGKVTLLQCTASYPAPMESMNLRSINWLKKRFNLAAGLSDHSKEPLIAPVAAVALGASVVEKHFTIDRKLPGPDHAFAIIPSELKEMVKAIRGAEKMLGSFVKCIDPSELELRSFARRGVQALVDIHPGDIFSEGVNVAILRPGNQLLGIHPKFIIEMEGKVAKRPILAGSGVQPTDWL